MEAEGGGGVKIESKLQQNEKHTIIDYEGGLFCCRPPVKLNFILGLRCKLYGTMYTYHLYT